MQILRRTKWDFFEGKASNERRNVCVSRCSSSSFEGLRLLVEREIKMSSGERVESCRKLRRHTSVTK